MIVLAVAVVVLASPLYFVVLDDDDSEDDYDVTDDNDVDALVSAAVAAVLDVCPWIIMMTIVEMPAVSSELLLMLLLYT